MKIMRMNENWNRINTREELIELLKNYEGILTKSMTNYLKSLIELEFSIIRDYIKNNDRIALSELEIYIKVAIYNIYNRALNLFEENFKGKEKDFIISGNNNGIKGLNIYASLGEKCCKLFDFNYQEKALGFERGIPYSYKTMKIGDISLFQTIENKVKKEAELTRIMSELEKLYDQKNPYNFRPNTYGGSATQWAFEKARKIWLYEEKFYLLDSKKELTDEDKKEIELTKKFHELLLEDYGLTNKDFEDESNQHFFEDKTELNKTLVKRMPNLNIKNNIKFI